MIKTIVFDIGGVYCVEGIDVVARLWPNKYGVLENEVYRVFKKTDYAIEARLDKIDWEDFFSRMAGDLKIDVDPEQLHSDWINAYELIDGMPELLDELKKTGFELLVLSNTLLDRDEHLKGEGDYKKYFSGFVLSKDVGLVKPDKRIFEKIHELTKSRGDEIVFIDDQEKNIPPAKELGWHVIKFSGASELRNKLKELGAV